MYNNISFNDIPQVLMTIVDKLESLERKVEDLRIPTPDIPDVWLSLKDLCAYLPNHPAEQTVYGWTSAKLIPYHKRGKNIVFRRTEIDEWLANGKKKSLMDIEREAREFISKKERRIK